MKQTLNLKSPTNLDLKVIVLAQELGITLADESPAELGYNWNGKKLAIKNDFSNVIHDIAHWLVANPKRRHLSEFGLGPSPDIFSDASRSISFKSSRREEERASILGIIIEKHLGLDWLHTWNYHDWKEGESFVIVALTWLLQKGLLTPTLDPKILKKHQYLTIQPKTIQKTYEKLIEDRKNSLISSAKITLS